MRLSWFLAVLLLVTLPAWGQEASVQSSILEDPFDFSHEPTLPQIEPASTGSIQSAIDRGIQFLIEDQNENGSWGSATRTKGLNI